MQELQEVVKKLITEKNIGVEKDKKGIKTLEINKFVEFVLNRYKLVINSETDEMYGYTNEGIYIKIKENDLKSILHKIIEQVAPTIWDTGTEYQYIELIKRKIRKSIELNPKDMIVFRNGLYIISKNQLESHSSDYYNTILIDAEYKKNPRALEFENFLYDIMGGKDITPEENEKRKEYLIDVLSYLISRENKLQKLFIFNGGGANGKSVILSILEKILGEGNVSHTSLAKMGGEFGLSALYDKILNISSENEISDNKLNTEIIKRLVGNDKIEVNRKFEKVISVKPIVKLLFSMNTLPRMNDQSYGIERRLNIVRFDKTYIPEEEYNDREKAGEDLTGIGIVNYDLESKLMNEIDEIASLLINNLVLLKDKDFKMEEPESMKVIKDEYIKNNDEILVFIEERIDLKAQAGTKVIKSDIYKAYKIWMEENHSGEKMLVINKFWERARNVFAKKGIDISERIVKINGYDYIKGMELTIKNNEHEVAEENIPKTLVKDGIKQVVGNNTIKSRIGVSAQTKGGGFIRHQINPNEYEDEGDIE